MVSLMGCSAQPSLGTDQDTQKDNYVMDSSQWLSSEQYKAIDEMVDEIKDHYQDNVQKMSLLKLDDQYYIAEFVWEDTDHWLHGHFYLFDVLEAGYTQLPFGGSSIKNFRVISFKDSVLTVLLETAFNQSVRSFPYLLKFNVLTEEWVTEPYFAELYEKYTLGAGHKLGFSNTAIHEDGKIVFCFQEIEGSELAGGLHAPTIKIAFYKENQKDICLIDMSDVYEQDNIFKRIQFLTQHKNVVNTRVREYVDALGENHIVIFLDLENVSTYSCGFIEQDTAISDYYVVFK